MVVREAEIDWEKIKEKMTRAWLHDRAREPFPRGEWRTARLGYGNFRLAEHVQPK
jgi:hypothetical protein